MPSHTSGTSSIGTQAPRRLASIGLVDSPPPTQTSKPGPCSGWTAPMNAMSLVWGTTSWPGCPLMAVLYLRGRFENALSPM